MAHLVAKDIYRRLGKKIDNLHLRAPWNDTFFEILKELYSPEEAEVVVKMPYLFSDLDRIVGTTGMEKRKLQGILKGLCSKGLVMDLYLGDGYKYMPSPFAIGIFEFTMMRTDDPPNMKRVGQLFHEYMEAGDLYFANAKDWTRVSVARTLPHEGAVADHVEILDYERAIHLIEEAGRYAVGTCSCRHKREHAGMERCDVPLGICTTFGMGAEYVIRHEMSREISKTEMLEIFERSRELGLIFSADNVQKRITFVCHCCGCCCAIMDGLNMHGLTTSVVTSSFIASVDEEKCVGCEKCKTACHVQSIEVIEVEPPALELKRKKIAKVDETICIGCGVCALKCETGAVRLVGREERVIHPETTFERVILQCLERGTLQNQLFDDPSSMSHKTMRTLLGGFLRLTPVKKALMSDLLRSTFLSTLSSGVNVLGKDYVHEL